MTSLLGMLLLTSKTQPARAELEAKWNSGSDFELGSFDSEEIDDALHTLGARAQAIRTFHKQPLSWYSSPILHAWNRSPFKGSRTYREMVCSVKSFARALQVYINFLM